MKKAKDYQASFLAGLECAGCLKTPSELSEYVTAAEECEYESAELYVLENEGTLNRQTGQFACTDCYIKAGQPSKTYPERWTA